MKKININDPKAWQELDWNEPVQPEALKKTDGYIAKVRALRDSAKTAKQVAAAADPEFWTKARQKAIENNPKMLEQIAESNRQYRKENPRTEEEKYACGNNMRGRTLEEILGEERAAQGREARRQANYEQDYTGRGEKIAATRRANGSYDVGGMQGKEHKESTKEMMAIKAQVRQQLKRELGLGKSDKVPKELLEERYILLGLKTQ